MRNQRLGTHREVRNWRAGRDHVSWHWMYQLCEDIQREEQDERFEEQQKRVWALRSAARGKGSECHGRTWDTWKGRRRQLDSMSWSGDPDMWGDKLALEILNMVGSWMLEMMVHE
jgi:hypothetical protein